MVAVAHVSWLTQVLRLIPPPLLKALDAWSYRLALKRAAKRRLAGGRPVAPEPIDYKLKHWRD